MWSSWRRQAANGTMTYNKYLHRPLSANSCWHCADFVSDLDAAFRAGRLFQALQNQATRRPSSITKGSANVQHHKSVAHRKCVPKVLWGFRFIQHRDRKVFD